MIEFQTNPSNVSSVLGVDRAINFPTQNPYDGSINGLDNAFVAKLIEGSLCDCPFQSDFDARGSSESVLSGIDAVSRRDDESYDEFVSRSGEHPIGRIVKIADLIDNSDTSRIANPTDRDQVRWKKYQRALAMLGADADTKQ